MRERRTARVLLFDPAGRILLMKGRLPSTPHAPGAWFTIGGGIESGESVAQAAAREIVEETGFSGATLGPEVWYGEIVLSDRKGRPLLFKDHYVLAHCAGGPVSRDGWQALELEFVDDIRWWTLGELEGCEDPVYPAGLAGLLRDLLINGPPQIPQVLRAPT